SSERNEERKIKEANEGERKGIRYDEFNKELFFIAGQIAMKLGNTTEAMEHIQQAVTLDHDYKEAVLALVELYKQQGMDEQIIDLLQTIKENGANDALYDWE